MSSLDRASSSSRGSKSAGSSADEAKAVEWMDMEPSALGTEATGRRVIRIARARAMVMTRT